jgi:large subunit ribosomal protein L25
MELIVEKRDIIGKGLAALREKGLVPAELYGHGTKNVHLAVKAVDFKKVFRQAGESTLIDVVLEGKKHPVMIHDVTFDPISDEPVSIDFYLVRMDEKITVKVPIVFVGESPAVKDFGGLLVKAMQEIEVEAFPNKIPHTIEVSLEGIKAIGESLHVKDINLSSDVTVQVGGETVIATVTEKKEEEVAPPVEISVADVKVETEEKKAERQAKKDAAEAETA